LGIQRGPDNIGRQCRRNQTQNPPNKPHHEILLSAVQPKCFVVTSKS
jgi:hypothetical protein